LNEILHGITVTGIKSVKLEQILDYLTNLIMCLEMMLKLLSDDWDSHKVGTMYQTVTKKPYPNQALMESLKQAIMSQKYLLSPAAGIVDHIPELEELSDSLYERIKEEYRGYYTEVGQLLPDNFGQFLLKNVEKYYRSKHITFTPGENLENWMERARKAYDAEVAQIKSTLGEHLSKGRKIALSQIQARNLI
jgi:hypothetical protein